MDACDQLVLGGRDDWRLPDINDVGRLMQHIDQIPVLASEHFPNLVGSARYVWSSREAFFSTALAMAGWTGDGAGAFGDNVPKTEIAEVRCVADR